MCAVCVWCLYVWGALHADHKKIVEIFLRKPSLNVRKPNQNGLEPYSLVMSQEVKALFDNFFNYQKSLMNNHPRVRIQQAQAEHVQKMFSCKPQDSVENKYNTDLRTQTKAIKSSLNSDHTTEENSGSFNNNVQSHQAQISLPAEEKVGPQHFTVHGLIGKGSFGDVYLVEKKDQNNLYAMKVLQKSKVMSKAAPRQPSHLRCL